VVLGDGLPDLHFLKVFEDEVGTTPGRVNLACFLIIASGMVAAEIFRAIWALAKLGAYVFLAAIKRLPPTMSEPEDVSDRSYAVRFGILAALMISCMILIEVPS
jgi:hypothetical protein